MLFAFRRSCGLHGCAAVHSEHVVLLAPAPATDIEIPSLQLPDETDAHTKDAEPLNSKSLAALAVSTPPQAPSQLPEVEAYACLLALLHLTDHKRWELVSNGIGATFG